MISSCPFAKHCECMVLIGVFIVTHLSFKESQQKKMAIAWVDLQQTLHKANCDLCSCPRMYFHKLVCIMKTKGHCSGNSPFLKGKFPEQ